MLLSIVMPCLNEHETVGICVAKAVRTLREHNIDGEVIVADNGSTDGSIEIAESLGARVVHVPAKGYGSALMGGIEAALGQYVLMGDADDSYDFSEAPKFLARLKDGYDLVQGCRLPAGGGTVIPGAMPWLHYWVGNPGLTWLARRMFHVPIHDIYCGMRGFSKAMYLRLNQQCCGMEFATEMIIKASIFGEKISEVPITLHPDGRKTGRPHLRTFRDGWRTLRFFLLFSPRWVFLYPSLVLIGLGLIGCATVYLGPLLDIQAASIQTLLVSCLMILVGYQISIFGLFARFFAHSVGILPDRMWLLAFEKKVKLEGLLLLGIFLIAIGVLLVGAVAVPWALTGFGQLDYKTSGLIVIPAVFLIAFGFLTSLSSFMLGLLTLHRRN
jgi:glycosyltransferase involved in cell wall biosynthesis